MKTEPLSEERRLDALKALDILDTHVEEAFDDLTHLAALICEKPMALITLVDSNRQWFKSRVGVDAEETPREVAFCHHTIQQDRLMEVPDTHKDERFADNPLVTGALGIRFYAGAPLITSDGYRLGSFCVLDCEPGRLNADQRDALVRLARQAVALMSFRHNKALFRNEVTKKQHIEHLLEKKQQEFLELFHADPVPSSLSVLETGEFFDVNEQFLSVLGCSREEVIGHTAFELGLWGDNESGRENLIENIDADTAVHNIERHFYRPDGSLIWVNASVALVELDGHRYLFGKFLDITEQKRLTAKIQSFNEDLEKLVAERSQELVRSENRYRSLFEASPDAMFLHNAGKVTFVNPAMLTLFKADTPSQLVGKNIFDFVHPDYHEQVEKRISQTHTLGVVPAMTQKVFGLDGTVIDVEVVVTSFKEGEETSSLVVLRDLAERNRTQRQTLELQARNEALVTALGEIVYDWRPDQDEIIWDGEFTRILGYSADEMETDIAGWLGCIHPDDVTMIMENVTKIKKEGRVYDWEYRFRHRNGSFLWISDRGYLMRDDAGQLTRILGVMRDITAQRDTQVALEESEHFAKDSLNALSAHIAVLDDKGTIISCNRSWRTFGESLGVDAKWIKEGGNYLEVCDTAIGECSEEAVHVAKGIRDVLEGRKAQFALEYPCHDADNLRWFMCRVTRLGLGDRRVVVAHENITEIKIAEAQLKEQQELNRLTLENLAEGVVACDAKGDLILFNKTAREWHGADPLSIPQEEWADYYDLYDADGVTPLTFDRIPLVRAFMGEVVHNVEMSIVRKGAAPRFVLASGEALFDAQGQKRGAVVVMHDVTERRKSDVVIQKSLHEKETLLKEIHHRVKNNLQVISSLLDMQISSVEDRVVKNLLLESIHRVRTMSMIHERLYQSETLARINLGEYAEDLVNTLFRSYSVRDDATLRIEVEPIEVNIETAVPCGLILNELISNAFKHAFKGDSDPHLFVQVARTDVGTYRLVVQDSGPGLPDAFDLDAVTTLGFQLIKTLVYQIKGQLKIDNDNGTRFCLEFNELPQREIG